jgi:CO/xanthine dehydrogenase FAD-binding subunit
MPIVSHHESVTPDTLAEALEFLAESASEGWEPFAGGTDVMVDVNYGRERRSKWVDLSRVAREISGIETDADVIRVGGAATMTELRRSELLREAAPMIASAAATVGALQIQNRATIAGNIVNASPAGDTLPVWLALDAEIELASAGGTRLVPYREFTVDYRTTVRRPDELVTAVRFRPLASGTRVLFRKVGTRAAQAISKVVLAAATHTDERGDYRDVRLAFGSMGPVPGRAASAEAAAIGESPSGATGAKAAARVPDDFAPIDDVRSTAEYRLRVAQGLVREFLAGRLGETVA